MKVLKRKGLLKAEKAEVVKEEPKQRKSHKGNTLPPDEYRDEIPPQEIILNEDGKVVISVKRGGLDGLPRLDIRYYATTEVYTGFTKKGINFDIVHMLELIEILRQAVDACDEKDLFEEFE